MRRCHVKVGVGKLCSAKRRNIIRYQKEMAIKKLIKRLGKFFIVLKEENRNALGQTVLIVDNGYSSFEHLFSGIRTVYNHYPKAELSVITLGHRRAYIEKEFYSLKFAIPFAGPAQNRYQIAMQMLNLRRKHFDLILLFSLDVSPLIAAFFFTDSKIILYNQWGQWWSISLRRISEVFKIAYANRTKKISPKNLLKKIGLFFVLLRQDNIGPLKRSVLMIDNASQPYEQTYYAIQRIRESLPQAMISILTAREELRNKFPEVELIEPEGFIFKKYRTAKAMLGLNNRYDYIILLSLDITPVFVSLLFMNSKVLLYNEWHQWWLIKPKLIKDYLIAAPRIVLAVIVNVLIFVYLVAEVSWIFLKRSFNIFKSRLLGKA